ncbi:hypothetical protein [Pseudidiomarina insulisalsae]|uniref:Uncharacterized protein n=1 Tax=Pseudidiomarina insulisalsae TaxID=575789 RepID=A0A432YHV6_9GAMM|nr:hypothetical protein [Pseudidiomarina insulisalsae]RUO60533.1 hypothetical protein CWI71_06610 [Pseudidiomarina insulisalsae]
MKAIIALITLVAAATATPALANNKAELEAAIGKSLHAQAKQVKHHLDQQSRLQQQRLLAELRGPRLEPELIVAEQRVEVKPSALKGE